MGLFEVNVGLGRTGAAELTPVTALVDTGAAHSVMPDSLLTHLGISLLEFRTFVIADGREIEYGHGMAKFGIEGREFPCPVVFGADEQYLLGATTLRIFNLMVDPSEERLIDQPFRARAF